MEKGRGVEDKGSIGWGKVASKDKGPRTRGRGRGAEDKGPGMRGRGQGDDRPRATGQG